MLYIPLDLEQLGVDGLTLWLLASVDEAAALRVGLFKAANTVLLQRLLRLVKFA